MKLIIILLLNVIASMVEAFYDVKRVKAKKPILHWRSDLIRAGSWVLVATFTHWLDLWPMFWVIIAQASVYWLIFDYAYNTVFGHDIHYLSKDSNFLDRFLLWVSKGNGRVAFIIKISVVVTSIIAYILS